MKKKSKYLLFILIFIVIISGVTYYYLRPQPVPEYVTEPVRYGSIEQTVLANGMIHASKLVSVGSQVSGQIKTLAVSLGQKVKKGDLIAQIDDLTQRNTLKEAQASLQSIDAQINAKKAQIDQAKLEFERQTRMLKDKASSQADFESAKATYQVYQAEYQQLLAERKQAVISVDSAKLDLSYTTITATMDGTVVYTSVSEGQTVNATQSTPTIVELADLDKMTIKAEISEADVINVRPGQAVYFTILGQSQHPFHTTVRAIEPGPTLMDGDDSDLTSSDDDAIYYNGLFDVDNPDQQLRIGMTAQVSIVLEKADHTLLVPAQILKPGKKPGRYNVPVLEDGQLVNKPVKVGINTKIQAQILEGLNEGDQVILGAPSQSASQSGRRSGPPMRF